MPARKINYKKHDCILLNLVSCANHQQFKAVENERLLIELVDFLKGNDSQLQGWLDFSLNETTLQGQDDRKASFILL